MLFPLFTQPGFAEELTFENEYVDHGADESVGPIGTKGPEWRVLGTLRIGDTGKGTLTILNGGKVFSTKGTIGRLVGSEGTVIVSGENASWHIDEVLGEGDGRLTVGALGHGMLSIVDGGNVTTVDGKIGRSGGSEGIVTVSGTGSTWEIEDILYIENGTLSIINGGEIIGNHGYIGAVEGSEGVATVSGVNSSWKNSSRLYVGGPGKGTLSITDGGKVTSAHGYIGTNFRGKSSEGIVTVTGANSSWKSSGSLNIGDTGKGTLTIKHGGRVTDTHGIIGNDGGSKGIVTVSGGGAFWENSGILTIGKSGIGSLTIENGGKATSTFGRIGDAFGSQGTVIVSGVGSTWANSDELYVGGAGNGMLTITDGGSVSNAKGFIGKNKNFKGTVVVSGVGSTWANSDELYVGNSSAGTLAIMDGGRVTNTYAYIGKNGGSEGAVTVSGSETAWDVNGLLFVGDTGKGTVTINDRGKVTSRSGFIGTSSGSEGSVMISGAGSSWVSTGNLFIGQSGNGTLAITDRSKVSLTGTDKIITLAAASGSTGTLIIGAGEGKAAVSAGTLEADSVKFGDGAGRIIFNHTDADYEFASKVSGNGSIDIYSGFTRLTGANIYTGGTSVYSGTLSVDAFSRLGAGGLLLDGGILSYGGLSDFTFSDFTFGARGGGFGVVSKDTTLTVSTPLSGNGQLTKTGAGTLKLTGTNTYSGGTDVVAGRLVGSAASIQGNLAISGGAVAEFYETGAASFAGTILGEGKLIKTGAGTLTLSGNNMYSGGTDVEAGKLIGTAASIKGPLALSADATVEFDQAIKGTFSGNISGEGKLIKSNTGELILTGINTYSGGTVITGGLISISDLAQLGSGEIILDGGTFQTTGDRTLETDDFDLGNAGGHLDIQGAGFKISGNIATLDGLLKTGQGKLLLDGADNKIGKTTIVKAGALIIGSTSSNNNAKLETDVELEETATLGGHGTLNGSVHNKGGVINPGNSVGTLTLTNYSGSGTLEIEVDSSDKANVKADKLIVSGTADFSQTELSLLFSPTSAQSWNIGPIEPLTIVELGGTAYANSHVFKQVTGELTFLHTTLDYQGGDGNDIVLSLTRNDVGFADKALTPNQEATAQALEALGYGHTLYNVVITNAKTDKDAQQIFDQLSGEINASLRNVLVEDTLVVRQAVSARGIQHSFGTNQAGQSSAFRNQYGFWAQGHGRWGTLDGNAETASITHQGGGMLMGMDVTTQSDLRLGAVFGYADLSLEATGRQSSASAMSYTAGAYASYLRDGWNVSAGLTNSWYDVDAERSIANGLLTDELTSQQSLRALQGFGEVGYSFDLEPAVLQPFVGAAYVNLASNGFKETGKEPALTVQSQSDDVFFSTLGLRGKTSFSVAGMNVNAHGMLAWQHASRDTVNFSQRFKGAADTFTITGAPIARDLALIETGFGMNVSENTNFALSYSGQLAPQSQNHGFNARMSVNF